MNPETARNLMLEILDYQDPETNLKLVCTADQHIEPMNIYVGNGELRNGEATVGRTILTYHFDTNALEMSRAEVGEGAAGQGFGSRYLEFVAKKLKEAGVTDFYANVNEAAASVVSAAGWTERPSSPETDESLFGLDLSNQ